MDDAESQIIAYAGAAYTYVVVEETQVPEQIQYWGIPRRWRGQNKTVQFGCVSVGRHNPGAPYMRIMDQSKADGEAVTYYRYEDEA